MKKSFYAVLAVAIVGYIGWAFIHDFTRQDARGLEIANDRAGRQAECETVEQAGATWGVCRTAGNPNVWQQRPDGWAAANGPAQMLVDRLATLSAEDLRNTPTVYTDRANPPQMPAGLL